MWTALGLLAAVACQTYDLAALDLADAAKREGNVVHAARLDAADAGAMVALAKAKGYMDPEVNKTPPGSAAIFLVDGSADVRFYAFDAAGCLFMQQYAPAGIILELMAEAMPDRQVRFTIVNPSSSAQKGSRHERRRYRGQGTTAFDR